jgi:hypothetical protein
VIHTLYLPMVYPLPSPEGRAPLSIHQTAYPPPTSGAAPRPPAFCSPGGSGVLAEAQSDSAAGTSMDPGDTGE